MACDSLYCAWLKAHYPYELYVTMLKLYDEKKNNDKISAIINEMKRYKDISMLPGKWGQDNRDWLVDKEHRTISQSLSSIRFMSRQAAQDLYELSRLEEAEMGVELIPAKLNKDGKAEIKNLKKQALETEDENVLEEIENQMDWVWDNPLFLETEAQEIHHTAKLDCFTNVLRAIQMHTCLDTRQVKILIELGYFSQFGGSAKLSKICLEFFEGENKLTKSIKSFNQRLETLRSLEASLEDDELPLRMRLQSEQENIGLCLTTDPNMDRSTYFVRNVDEKWGTTVTIYSIRNGRSGSVRFRKGDLQKVPVVPNQLVRIIDGNNSPRYTYKDGKRTPIPGEKEYWVKQYEVV